MAEMVAKSDYLKASKAGDIPARGGRVTYRLFEILPGALAWITIAGIFAASRWTPLWASFFIIAFDLYWFFKTVFLSMHLRAGYAKMQEHLKTDWLAELRKLKIENSELKIQQW